LSEAPPGDREATIWEHIEELAIRLRRIVIAFFVAATVLSILPAGRGKFLYVPLIARFPELIFQHVVPKTVEAFDGNVYNVTVIPTQTTESIEILAQTLFLLGFIGASPIIAKEIWEYIEPALYPHEKAFAKKYIVLFILAFLFGVFFGIYLAAPLIEMMFLKLYPLYVPASFKDQFILKVSVSEVVSFALKLGLAFGALFELPIIIYLLLAYGVVDPDLFNETTMKYIFLGTMILGAIISPDPSGLGMLLIGFSLYIPIYVAVRLGKKRAIEKKVAEELKALVEG
jgi:sec-independent protein translocase protein TatC